MVWILILTFLALIEKSTANNIERNQSLSNEEKSQRNGKFLSFFQIVTFPNDICTGSGSNVGTCYTSEECESRGGSSSGSCASGFGVCCIFSLACGAISSENCTYLTQTATDTLKENPCTYTICRCNSNICRIKLDFTTFDIAGPQEGTTVDDAPAETGSGSSIGDCLTDQFSVTAPGNRGSPIICGFNTGQHMFLDASSQCNVASFSMGEGGGSRQWNIKVTQYKCGDEDNGGPPGCLQYFSEREGTVASFNFPTSNINSLGPSTTHLQNQCYLICFRRASGYCQICFSPSTSGNTANMQSSFGLSGSPQSQTAAKSGIDSDCTTDFLQIPGASNFQGNNFVSRLCGRYFKAMRNENLSKTVCTELRPFQMKFVTDGTEVDNTADSAATNEQLDAPGGITGFSLEFFQTMTGCD